MHGKGVVHCRCVVQGNEKLGHHRRLHWPELRPEAVMWGPCLQRSRCSVAMLPV